MTLPEGWGRAPIGDLCDLINGKAFKPSDWSQTGLPIIRIQNLNKPDAEYNFCDFKVDEKFIVETGELLFAWSGTPGTSFGAHVWNGPRAVLNQHIFRVRFDEQAIDRDFFKRAINSTLDELIGKAHGGVGLAHVTKGKFEETTVPFPPHAEQRRIVAKLDALTARLARARAELDRVPVLASRLRTNVLRAVFGRGEADLPAGWQIKRIDEIGDVQLGRQRSPKDHHGPHMRPYVRSANITWKGWDLSDVKEMNFSPEEFETFQLRPGDVLLNEGSGSAKEVGKPAIWNGEIEGACFQNTLLRVRPVEYSPELLRYAFLYLALSGQFIANTKGVNIIHIGKAGLAKTKLPVPRLDAQEGLLSALDVAFARADRLEADAARARALINRLEAAILGRAFRGELVPQDPDDEPASALLDRIRAERAAAPKAKRGRRSTVG